jgi:anaerobic magnesium-protoporphyrin IX monomethyl ester cyclase
MRVALLACQPSLELVAPLGPLSMAAVLERAGHEVWVWDVVEQTSSVELDQVAAFAPDLVGVSFLTPDFELARDTVAACRERLPDDVLYTAGGVHVSALPDASLRALGVDFLVVGEGELTLLEVCDRLERGGRDVGGIAGVVHWVDGCVCHEAPRPPVHDLDSLPFPARHRYAFAKTLTPPGMIRGYFLQRCATVMATRGCSHSCIYCASAGLAERKMRHRSVDSVIDEIEGLKRKYAIDGVFFPDDTLTFNRRWLVQFCESMVERGVNLPWGCLSRVDTLSAEVMQLMARAGCVQIEFGVESGSPKVLNALKKKTTPEQARAAFAAARAAGVRTLAYFIVGNPEEGPDEIDMTLQHAEALAADCTAFTVLTPYPGTELYDLARANGWIAAGEGFDHRWNAAVGPRPVMSIRFTADELLRIQGRLQRRFMLRNFRSYFRDPRFLLGLAMAAARRPAMILGGVVEAVRSRRLYLLARAVFGAYKMRYQRRSEWTERPPVAASITVDGADDVIARAT